MVFTLGALLTLPVALGVQVDPAVAKAHGPATGDDKDPVPAKIWQVKSFGSNTSGQLGDATFTNRQTAVTVAGVTEVRALDACGVHTLALLRSGAIESWGSNAQGQLGDGTKTNHPTAGIVTGLTGVKAVGCGSTHSLAVLSNGKVKSWGSNTQGELGTGSFTPADSSLPVDVINLTGVKAVAGGSHHSLALLSNGKVMSWGANQLGQLGAGSLTPNRSATPVEVTGLTNVKAIAADGDDSLALLSNGKVMSWGSNQFGVLGTGSFTPDRSATPVEVTGLTGVKAISAGGLFNLALLSNGKVKSWGYNGRGRLGTGSLTPDRSATPVDVVELAGVKAISAGGEHSLALQSNGIVKGWGNGSFGQLDNGRTDLENPTPSAIVTGLAKPRVVSAGGFFSLVA